MTMVDGKGELDLDQCKKITDEWAVYSDLRPLVAEKLWKEIEELRSAIKELSRQLGESVPRSRYDVACSQYIESEQKRHDSFLRYQDHIKKLENEKNDKTNG